MQAPEPMPKRAANMMIAAWLRPGSQRPRTMMVEKRTVMVVTLKRPYLSAIMLGSVRPMKLSYREFVSLILQLKRGQRKLFLPGAVENGNQIESH